MEWDTPAPIHTGAALIHGRSLAGVLNGLMQTVKDTSMQPHDTVLLLSQAGYHHPSVFMHLFGDAPYVCKGCFSEPSPGRGQPG